MMMFMYRVFARKALGTALLHATVAGLLLVLPGASMAESPDYHISPLQYRGEPFFVLGTYDPPSPEDAAEWKSAGGNTVLIGHASPPEDPAEVKSLMARLIEESESLGAAYIYFPGHIFYESVKNPSIRPEAEARFNAMLDVTVDHPNTLGYWTVDEPENKLYAYYKKNVVGVDRINDSSFGEWLATELRWTYDLAKQRDPDSYVIPTIGWWTTYKETAPLYDANVPNEYPTYTEDEPMTGPLYNAVYDAGMAAEAIRQTGAESFIYMPGICDNWPGDDDRWRAPTRFELRYLYFAPITQGAQGILSWRLGRSSLPYRRAVIYPTMHEVSALIPWFLGEWCDEMVRSNRQTPTADYLKEFPERIRTVVNEGRVRTVSVKGVPDVSHIVRKHPDGSYLLLAVSNRKEPIKVTFTLSGFAVCPEFARDHLSWRKFDIKGGKLQDELEPFGVRAYLFDETE